MAGCLALLSAGAVLLHRMDAVTKHYSSRADAETDKLFERGWLPPIIPLSASNIAVTNNPDTNTSAGSFTFDPREAARFTAALTRVEERMTVPRNHDGNIEPGVTTHTHGNGGSQWTFYISAEKGRCNFVLEQREELSR